VSFNLRRKTIAQRRPSSDAQRNRKRNAAQSSHATIDDADGSRGTPSLGQSTSGHVSWAKLLNEIVSGPSMSACHSVGPVKGQSAPFVAERASENYAS
jgi:hypothetical protein